jgi:hypothetical protein
MRPGLGNRQPNDVDSQSLNGGFTGNPTVSYPHFHIDLKKPIGQSLLPSLMKGGGILIN